MKKAFASLLLTLFFAHSTVAADLLRSDHPDSYEVKSGDTLWDIASKFLNDAWQWQEIWEVNPDIKNPHLIFPGDVVYLRYVDGKPTLAVNRGEAGRTVKLTPMPAAKSRNGVKLAPQIREIPLTSSIPAIPLDAISNLLTRGRIVDEERLENAPYILAGKSDRLVMGPGDQFYARGNWPNDRTAVYGIFREGEVYRDPETRDILGYEAIEVGTASVIQRNEDDVYTMELSNVNQDIRKGDRLLPTEQRALESMFFPKSPNTEVEGVIMTVLGGVSQVGRHDVVAINRGVENGLAVGDVLAIHKRGKMIRDRIGSGKVRLPSERAGMLMIFRSFDRMAYGLILETTEALRIGDLVQNP